MASSKQPSSYSSTPARPSLKIPTKPEKAPRQHLVLQEDQAVGQYQVRSFGGAGSASAITLDDWRPIDWIPQNLIGTESPDLPTHSRGDPTASPTARPSGIARFGAWIKRSGKGLVVRLRRQGPSATADYTDYHFNTYSQSISELADSPIIELPTTPSSHSHYIDTRPLALTGIYNDPFSELPGSETSTELPTIHGWSELDVLDRPVPRSHGHTVDLYNANGVDSTRYPASAISSVHTLGESILSRTSTSKTYLSTANTAVGSVEGEVASPSEMPSLNTSQPVVRGLTVCGSVRYKCDLHPDFEPASPVEVARLVSKACRKGINSTSRMAPLPAKGKGESPGTDIKVQAEVAVVEQHKQEDQHPSVHTPASISKPKLAKRFLEPSIPSEEQSVFSMQAQYGLISSRTVYQQDLHLSKACTETHMFATQVFGLPHPALEKLEEIKRLLEKTSIRGALNGDGQALGSDPRPASSPIHHRKLLPGASTIADTAQSETVNSSSVQQLSCPPASPTIAEAHGLEHIAPPSQASNLRIQALKDTACAEGHNTASPISPLSTRERLEQSSCTGAHFVPVTPLTAHQARGQRFHESVGHNAQPHSGGLIQRPVEGEASPQDASFGILKHNELVTVARDGAKAAPTLPAEDFVDTSSGEDNEIPDAYQMKFIADCFDHQQSPAPIEAQLVPPLETPPDDKILARYKSTRFKSIPQIDTTVAAPQVVMHEPSEGAKTPEEVLLRTGRAEPRSRGILHDTSLMMVSALVQVMLRSTLWVQRHASQEPPIPEGHVRVRWVCNCGEHLYDDFIELRPGAAATLEAILNREKTHPNYMPRSGSRGSQSSYNHTPGSSHPSNSATSGSSRSAGSGPPSAWPHNKGTPVQSQTPSYRSVPVFPMQQQQYLLTCVNESRNTPKLTQIALHQKQVQTDTDLANALRDHYALVNRQWYRFLRLRGLTSIEFVQFYMHRNRFADIRKCPDVPPITVNHDYDFTPNDLLPPVGGRYLLHLFKHPQEYDDEVVAYLSIPKKSDRLHHGIGWGITLTEGYLPERIWLFVLFTFVLFGCIFAVVWTVKEHDIQGAFGVASFLTTLAGMALGFAQACLG